MFKFSSFALFSLVAVLPVSTTNISKRLSEDMGRIMGDIKQILAAVGGNQRYHCQQTQNENILPKNCKEAHSLNNNQNGLVSLQIHQPFERSNYAEILPAYCEYTMEHSWLVLMRREDLDDNNVGYSDQTWDKYKNGFGDPSRTFWIGLENMHILTKNNNMILRVDLEDWEGETRYAEYSYFMVSSEQDGYRIFIDGYSGNAGDSLKYQNGQRFSTEDRDNDNYKKINCAETYNGAWWYNKCLTSCLTGIFYNGVHDHSHQGVYWRTWRGTNYSYRTAEMKVKLKE